MVDALLVGGRREWITVFRRAERVTFRQAGRSRSLHAALGSFFDPT